MNLNENQIIVLCEKYENKLDMVAGIVAAFLEQNEIHNAELVNFMCQKGRQEWLPGLLRQGKLQNSEQRLLISVDAITNRL
jgi:predicted transcriptional regulator